MDNATLSINFIIINHKSAVRGARTEARLRPREGQHEQDAQWAKEYRLAFVEALQERIEEEP
ncbi:MAG: hypothetical protein J07HQW1_00283 [Haloquadratum walsbyi J07HQW1]|jgi:hypothetical protein|uniref:Uncharacterized protein n=1 Tax=Haloquadratum walsbyi J07HQW1 TaxID=1238424 RepID=U1N1B8_9EURY|nr:MAG: hypothetical protein J07HQW1_00283 [Haloquadratum walsbyi J07HQW1]